MFGFFSTAAHFEIVFPRRFDIEKPTQEAPDLSRCRTRVSPPLGTHETRRGEVCRADTTSIPRLIIFKSVYGSHHFQLWNVSWKRVDRNTESSSSWGMGTPELKIVSVLGFAFAGNKMASKRKLDANIVPFDTFSHHFLLQEAKHFLKDSKSLVRPCTKY